MPVPPGTASGSGTVEGMATTARVRPRLAAWARATLVGLALVVGTGCARGGGDGPDAASATQTAGETGASATTAEGAGAAPDGSNGSGDEAAASTSAPPSTDPPESDAPRPIIADGDCFDAPSLQAGIPLDPMPLALVLCSDPHQYEVYGIVAHPSSAKLDFPGTDSLKSWASDQCLSRFGDFVGKPYDQSTLDFTAVLPTEDTWKDGDRKAACLLYQVDFAELTGSVRNSGM